MQKVTRIILTAFTFILAAPVLGPTTIPFINCDLTDAAQAQSLTIPTTINANQDPKTRISTIGNAIFDVILYGVTFVAAIALVTGIGFVVAGKPLPRLIFWPLIGGGAATCLGWMIKLVFGVGA